MDASVIRLNVIKGRTRSRQVGKREHAQPTLSRGHAGLRIAWAGLLVELGLKCNVCGLRGGRVVRMVRCDWRGVQWDSGSNNVLYSIRDN